ncbi:putative ATP-dependent zinc protease [Vibrio gallicus]|uniref:putative ATP-dependent zinc protease n=1 Tax=Vibrio gallicus TaxID=190897 RepID=UPI0021C2DB7D|nr:RimK/LysX family protein [Vibrio gallicus]
MNKRLTGSISLLASLFLSAGVQAKQTTEYTMLDDNKQPYTTAAPALSWDDKVILGRVESVYYQDIAALEGIAYIGKIDTGADTTSMHAENIKVYSENPKYKGLQDTKLMQTIVDEYGGPKSNWWLTSFDTPERNIQGIVEFEIRHPVTGKVISLQRPLARTSVIRSRTSEIPLYRPVINIPLTIAGVTVNTDVNLTDRSNFSAPILIGKTFLKQHAWVFAGYDYLQAQQNAVVLRKGEEVTVGTVSLKSSYSLVNSYSQLHATDIQIDHDQQLVTFNSKSKSGNKAKMTLPLIRMLKVGGSEKPLVSVPMQVGKTKTPILAYLKDRSKYASQIRIGKNSLSKHFVIHSSNTNAVKDQTYASLQTNKKITSVTPHEIIYIDDIAVEARPSFAINTPVLFVSNLELGKGKNTEQVSFYIPNAKGENKKVIRPVVRKIRVGESVRPVIKESIIIGNQQQNIEFALEVVDKGEDAYFAIGRGFNKQGVLINTRTEDLFEPRPLFSAGYIEKASVAGLRFSVKLDTGADVSSMNALNIKRFDENGKPMVSFDYHNSEGQKHSFTREVVDIMRIRAKAGEKPNERPVVMMKVSLGDVSKSIRVNLQDRSRFEYSMILGKNFLKNGVVVSSDDTYLLGKQ